MVKLNLEHLLKKENKTRYWLVHQLNSTYATVNPLVSNATSSIKFDTINKLLKIFNCTPNELFIVEDD